MRVLDLFSGGGAMSLGLERAGMRTVAFCEIASRPRQTLAKHWPGVPIYDDVRTLTVQRLRADGIAVDVICGGFPCQDISPAGKRVGIDGERSGLWSEMARLVGEIRPRAVIIENSGALVVRGLHRVLRDLAAVRYDAEWGRVGARDVGAPHRRDRTWIVAYPERSQRGPEPYLRAAGRMGRQIQSVPWNRHWEVALREFRGVDDGSAYRVDRIDVIRNAVVPQIPELIGRAILAAEARLCVTAPT